MSADKDENLPSRFSWELVVGVVGMTLIIWGIFWFARANSPDTPTSGSVHFANCDPLPEGTQVVVTDSHNDVVATGVVTLRSGCEDLFRVSGVPGGLERYGISVGRFGPVWVTPDGMKHPKLEVG